MSDCEKCGKIEYGGRTNLVGGLTATLCTRCCNLWHEYIVSSGLWEQFTLMRKSPFRLPVL